MRRLSVALASGLLLAAGPVLAGEAPQPPVHSTFQDPPPPGAGQDPPAKRWPWLPKLEAPHVGMPKVNMPEMPSLPDMLKSVGALPERVGLPNANQLVDQQFDKLVAKLNVAIPAVETLGFEVRNFEVDWTLPPKVRVRLQSHEDVTDAEYEAVLASIRGDLFLESIILSLGGVRKIQHATNLAPFKRAAIDVEFGLPPHVIMTFSDPTNRFLDRFRENREKLRQKLEAGGQK